MLQYFKSKIDIINSERKFKINGGNHEKTYKE